MFRTDLSDCHESTIEHVKNFSAAKMVLLISKNSRVSMKVGMVIRIDLLSLQVLNLEMV